VRRLVVPLTALAVLILAIAPPARAGRTDLNPPAIGGIPVCRDSRVFCVGKQAGAEYDTICGMTPGTGGANSCGDATDTCTATSAVGAAIASGLCSQANPCTVMVGRGVWNECVHIDNVKGFHLKGAGAEDTIINPGPITAATDIDNGTVRVGAATNTPNATQFIELSDFTAYNHAHSPPEAAIQIGKDAGPGTGNRSAWSDVYVHDVKAVGNHDAIQWYGSALTTDTDLPIFTLTDFIAIGGHDTLVKKGFNRATVSNGIAWANTAYCETADPNITALRTGTVDSGTSTTVFALAASEEATTDSLVGREIQLSAGTCAAGASVIVTDYTSRVVTVTPALAFTPDNTCTYTLPAVNDPSPGLCLDPNGAVVDWSASPGNTFWKTTAFHFGIATGASIPAGEYTDIIGVAMRVDVKDFGSAASSACTAQAHATGLLIYVGRHNVNVINSTVDVRVWMDMLDSISCTDPISAISFTGSTSGTLNLNGVSAKVANAGDPDENVRGVISMSTGSGSVRVGSVYADVDNTVAGYAGTSTLVYQANTSTLGMGRLTSPDAITVTADAADFTLLSGASMTGSATIDFGNLAAVGCAEVDAAAAAAVITVPGAADGDPCDVSEVAAATTANSQFTCRVSAANTVTVKHCCFVGGCNPASGTFRATVTRQ
jgi:hypothetical protein